MNAAAARLTVHARVRDRLAERLGIEPGDPVHLRARKILRGEALVAMVLDCRREVLEEIGREGEHG